VPLRIAQNETYKGDDWWQWSVWLEADAAELDAIEFVQYTLHHTFAQPVRRTSNRAAQFRLDSSGWGGFTIYAKAVQKDSSEITLQHQLKLYYPAGT
jgi:transcription initiation factor IIF auxiliary subunit